MNPSPEPGEVLPRPQEAIMSQPVSGTPSPNIQPDLTAIAALLDVFHEWTTQELRQRDAALLEPISSSFDGTSLAIIDGLQPSLLRTGGNKFTLQTSTASLTIPPPGLSCEPLI